MNVSQYVAETEEDESTRSDLAEKAAAGKLSVDDVKESSLDDLFHILGSDRRGLSTEEAKERLERFGYNEIEEHKASPILKFLSAFWGPIPWMIEAAAILSALVQRWDDFGIIFALLLINAVVGFWQEHKAVIKIGDYLILLTLALAAVIFLVALFRHESLLQTLQFVLILTVAAIPAALPAVLSVTMAVGASALARKEVIVSKLVAIEELACMDVLCSDKTGTITENKLTVGDIVPFSGYKEADVLVMATMASREEDRDPIDDTILARMKRDVAVMSSVGGFETTSFTPFDPVSTSTALWSCCKRMSTSSA